MTAVVWPFKPLTGMIESLEWLTDILQSKSLEQRIALREAPRRVFNMEHILTDYQYTAAREIIRAAQGADGLYCPDWTQRKALGAVTAGTDVIVGEFDNADIGGKGLLYESPELFEIVDISLDSNSQYIMDSVTGTYDAATLMPLWLAHAPNGISASRIGNSLNSVSVEMNVYENSDLSYSGYPQYLGEDVLTDCPVIAGGGLDEGIVWPVTRFDNEASDPYYLRSRDIPDRTMTMRWYLNTDSSLWGFRRWLHSRRGRQKAFWYPSGAKDIEPVGSVSGTTLNVYAPSGYSDIHTPLDIAIKSPGGTVFYRRVTSSVVGTPVGGRATLDLTLSSSATTAIERISFLSHARFNADRVEIEHRGPVGAYSQIPFIEIA